MKVILIYLQAINWLINAPNENLFLPCIAYFYFPEIDFIL